MEYMGLLPIGSFGKKMGTKLSSMYMWHQSVLLPAEFQMTEKDWLSRRGTPTGFFKRINSQLIDGRTFHKAQQKFYMHKVIVRF